MPGLDPGTQAFDHQRMSGGWVYILASKRNGTLYIGVTSDLARRVFEHRAKQSDGFTKRYGVTMLVHCERFNEIALAIQREKALKKWPRR